MEQWNNLYDCSSIQTVNTMTLVCPNQGLLVNNPSMSTETEQHQLFVECPQGCPLLMAFPSKNDSLLVVSGTYENEYHFYLYEDG
jgi:hypothetical protein